MLGRSQVFKWIFIGSIFLFGAIIPFIYQQSYQQRRIAKYPFKIFESSEIGAHEKFLKERIERTNSGLDMGALAEVYLKKARQTGETQWMDEAERWAEKSLKNLPFSNSGARLALAKIYESRHQFNKSIQMASSVLKKKPGDIGALATLVTSHLGKGSLLKAHEYADRLVELSPSLGAYAFRALVWEGRGKGEKAIRDFRRALNLEDIGEVERSTWVRSLIGRYYYRRGEYKKAKAYLEECLRIIPKYVLAVGLLGKLAVAQGDLKGAEAYFQDGYLFSGEPPFLIELGKLKNMQGKLNEAKRLFLEAEKVVREELTETPYGHATELVQIFIERGMPSDAKEAVALALGELKTRQNWETYLLVAQAYSFAGEPRRAAYYMGFAIRSGIESARLYTESGKILTKLNRRRAATMAYLDALRVNPKYTGALNALQYSQRGLAGRALYSPDISPK